MSCRDVTYYCCIETSSLGSPGSPLDSVSDLLLVFLPRIAQSKIMMTTTSKHVTLDKSITDVILHGQTLLRGLLELVPQRDKMAAVIRELEDKLTVMETDNNRLRSERDHFKRKLVTLEERVRGEIGVVRSAVLLSLQSDTTNNNNTNANVEDDTVISGPIDSERKKKVHRISKTDLAKPKKFPRVYASAHNPRKTPRLLSDKICPTCFKTIAKGEVSSAWVNHTKKCLGLAESC
jgi:hypothetical protein